MQTKLFISLGLVALLAWPLGARAQTDPETAPSSYDAPPKSTTTKTLPSYDQAAVPPGSAAFAAPEEAKRFRLVLDRPFLVYNHHRETVRETGGRSVDDPSTSANNNFDTSFLTPLTTFGFSFALAEQIHLGTFLTLDTDVSTVPGGSYGTFYWQFAPFIEIIFGREVLRPYFLGTMGVAGLATNPNEDAELGDPGASLTDSSAVFFVAGAGGGLHIHPDSWISLDMNALAIISVGPEWVGSGDAEIKTRLFDFNLRLGWGVSLWF